jgi:D-xylonolactonase
LSYEWKAHRIFWLSTYEESPDGSSDVTTKAQVICSIGAELGVGTIWVPQDQALWFVDIAGRVIHRYQPASEHHSMWATPERVSFVLPRGDGGFLVGLDGEIHHFDALSGEFQHVTSVEPHLPDNRINDACVSPQGELWFGSMHDLETDPSGALYRLDREGHITALDHGYIVSNGPAFSPNGRIFYHTDTYRRVIYAFNCNADWQLSDKRILVQLEESAGFPDGTSIDAEGCLWIALWGGWGVRRYSPVGTLLESVQFPCANVTKLAFGGTDYRTALVTTAWRGLSATERSAQPTAGDLFSFRTEVPGLAPVDLELREAHKGHSRDSDI